MLENVIESERKKKKSAFLASKLRKVSALVFHSKSFTLCHSDK